MRENSLTAAQLFGPVPATADSPSSSGSAEGYLLEAERTMRERAKERGKSQERALPKTVEIFKAMTGIDLTVTQAAQFMMALKLARISGRYKEDDFVDLIAYAALGAEAAKQENQK